MNKYQYLVQKQFLNNEEVVLKRLKSVYNQAAKDVNAKIEQLQLDIDGLTELWTDFEGSAEEKAQLQSRIQSKIYQKQYQTAIQGQIDDVLKNLQNNAYKTISEYLDECYTDGYIGAFFGLHGQGIPLIMPLDQEAMVRAVQLDSKISEGLYNHLGENYNMLKKHITAQVSRGLANGFTFAQVAQQLTFKMSGTYNNPGGALAYAMRIARTEGHRIQVQGAMDACYKAKDMGADVVKQWDATLDGRTRASHARVDGEIKELDEKFSNGLMFPGDPSGKAAEVINCRCALLERARWALDEAELETLKERAEYFGLDKSNTFEEYKQKYLKAAEKLDLKTPGEIGEKAVPYSQRGIDIETRLKGYLNELHENGDYISAKAGTFKGEDLAILTTETGVEYTTLTIGKESYLIRGMEKGTTIPKKLKSAIIENKGTLDFHSHPFIGDLVPSNEDKDFLKLLTWQGESVIIDPEQSAVSFTVHGTTEKFKVETDHTDDYWSELFGEGD